MKVPKNAIAPAPTLPPGRPKHERTDTGVQLTMGLENLPQVVNLQGLLDLLLRQDWQRAVKFRLTSDQDGILAGSRRLVAYYPCSTGPMLGLRHSGGPLQSYFWDVYGDDLQTLELAIWAVAHAPAPHRY